MLGLELLYAMLFLKLLVLFPCFIYSFWMCRIAEKNVEFVSFMVL